MPSALTIKNFKLGAPSAFVSPFSDAPPVALYSSLTIKGNLDTDCLPCALTSLNRAKLQQFLIQLAEQQAALPPTSLEISQITPTIPNLPPGAVELLQADFTGSLNSVGLVRAVKFERFESNTPFPTWNPTDLSGLALWLDANSSYVIRTGTVVSEWRDRSGALRHYAQSLASNQPTYDLGQATALQLLLDDYVVNTSYVPAYGPTTIWAVFTPKTVSSASARPLFHTNGTDIPKTSFALNSGGINIAGTIVDVSALVPINQPCILVATISGTGTCTVTVTVNGNSATQASATATRAGVNNFGTTTTWIGANSAINRFFVGDINSIGLANSQVSTQDRQKLEGYLAHLYNIASVLPSTHPYKNNPPGI